MIIGSLLSQERGLKSDNGVVLHHPGHVAPLAGAWIEISRRRSQILKAAVAPLAGAWIEMVLFWQCLALLLVAHLVY
ncbi:MAG: hypothetical protein PWP56_1240 [Acetobacterium sp.]|nr:hypothetical protein [Acetobacterium sp.]